MKKILIIIVIIILIILFCFTLNKKKTENISALSYLKITNNVPKNELLLYFVNKYNNDTYKNYFNKIINLKIKKTPVYVIKKINNNYEYEVYLYRYDTYRIRNFIYKNKDYLDVTLENFNTFPKKEIIDQLDVKLYNNYLFKQNEKECKLEDEDDIKIMKDNKFIIVSYDVNDKFFESKKSTFNYYYRNNEYLYTEEIKEINNNYTYYIKEEDYNGNILKTNIYNLFYSVFENEDKEKYLVNLFESDDCIIFYAYKPKTDTHAFYYEKSTFEKFVSFLEYFKYDNEIINYVKNTYNNTYDFCFSYDMDNDYIVQKTAIFSIF